MQKGRDEHRLAATAGVRIERNDRHCVVYRGTRAALIAAGLARPGHFPEGQRRFSWHFPKSGVNWGVRRKHGEMYCLTKLKDPQGVVEAELAAFYGCAEGAARSDTRFQRILQQIVSDTQAAPSPASVGRDAAQRPLTALPVRAASQPGRMRSVGEANAANLETLAFATLLVGLTVYLWTRQG